MTPLRKITTDLLKDLEDEFLLVELQIHSENSVKLRVYLPVEAKEGTATRRELSLAYGRILKRHGIETEEKPHVVNGMTRHIVSAKIKGDAA